VSDRVVSERRTFGTTREERSGRWTARYTLDGRQISVPGTFPTKKAAERRLASIQTDLAKGAHIHPARASVTLREWWDEYASTKTDWAPRTREEREGLWRRHLEPAFGDRLLGAITTPAVRSWYATLHASRPATARGAYRLLRQVLHAAVDDNRLGRNPCQLPGAGVDKAPERTTATLHEVEAIIADLPEHLRLMVLLATWCGLRSSELHGLRRADVDTVHLQVTVARAMHELDDGSVVFREPKTAAGRRTLAYPPSIHAEVVTHLERFVGASRDDPVFVGERSGEPLRPGTFGKFWRRARIAAGRPDLHFHDLRHTSLTLAAATGATLPELMHRAGHSTPNVALRYLHATKDRDRIISEALSELRPLAEIVEFKTGRSERL
jgi:integrase